MAQPYRSGGLIECVGRCGPTARSLVAPPGLFGRLADRKISQIAVMSVPDSSRCEQ